MRFPRLCVVISVLIATLMRSGNALLLRKRSILRSTPRSHTHSLASTYHTNSFVSHTYSYASLVGHSVGNSVRLFSAKNNYEGMDISSDINSIGSPDEKEIAVVTHNSNSDTDSNDDSNDDSYSNDHRDNSGDNKTLRPKNFKLKVRQHVNPLASAYQKPLDLTDNWIENEYSYSSASSFIIDVGCAKGSWALKYGALNPDVNILGLEIRRPVVDYCLQRKAKKDLKNVHFLCSNANVDLKNILRSFNNGHVSGRSDQVREKKYNIDTICFQFPDPHFKSKHKKRRVINQELVALIAQNIQPGTKIYLQSDIQELEEFMCENFATSPYFEAASGYHIDQLQNNLPLFGIATEREISVLARNLSVFRMVFLRNDVMFELHQ